MTTTADELLNTIGRKLEASENSADEFDAIGKTIACKLRRLSETSTRTRIFAEKIINDVLYYAELGYINQNSHVAINGPAETEPTNSVAPSQLGQDISACHQGQGSTSADFSYNGQAATQAITTTASSYIQNVLTYNSTSDQWE